MIDVPSQLRIKVHIQQFLMLQFTLQLCKIFFMYLFFSPSFDFALTISLVWVLPFVFNPPPLDPGDEKLVPPKPKIFPLAPPPELPFDELPLVPGLGNPLIFGPTCEELEPLWDEDELLCDDEEPLTKLRISFWPFFRAGSSFVALLLPFFWPNPSGSLILVYVPPQFAYLETVCFN